MLDLLPSLFAQIWVPGAVVAELAEGQRQGVSLPNLENLPWLQVRVIHNRTLLPLVTHLGDGEKEVIALGLELSGALLLLDDRDARRHARALELEISGTLGVLLLAKVNTSPQVIPFVPPDFAVPETLETQEFRLLMLTVNDVVKDIELERH